jgi:hypothetical protein
MVAIAGTIIKPRSGHFDPATFRDRYQEVLRELIEAKMKGLPVKPKQIATPAPVLDLMSALKRSLAQETGAVAKPSRRAAGDRRQTSLLLPVPGKKEKETSTQAMASLPATQAYLDGELCGVRPDGITSFSIDPGGVGRRQRGGTGLLSVRSPAPRRGGSLSAAADRAQGAARRVAGGYGLTPAPGSTGRINTRRSPRPMR